MFKTKPTISAWTKSVLTPLMFLMAVVAYAQPTTVVTTSFTGTKNWSDGTAWSGGSAPSSGDNVQIGPNAKINLDSDVSISTLTLSGTGVLNCGSYTVTITDQFYANTCTGLNAQTGTFIFNSTVASGGSQRTIDGTCTSGVTFYNVEIPSSAVVDFGPAYDGVTPTVESTITNELLLDGGGVVKNPPIYGGSSTLRYNNAYVIGTEWTMGATSGGGVPHHVSVEGSSSLDFADSTGVYTCLGNFDIVGPSSSIDLSDFLGDLKVTLDFSAGTANSATITMPTTEGKGNLVVLGDLTLGASATVSGDEGNLILAGDFTHNATSSAFGMVKFNGAGADQDLTGNGITVDSLVVANTNNTATNDQDVDLNANVDITPGGVFNPVDGTTNISGTFTMNSDASGTARIATLENSGATSNVVGNITFERYISADAGVTWLSAGNYVVGATLGDWATSFGSDFFLTFKWDETHILNNSASSNGASWWSTISGNATVLEDSDYGYYVLTMPNSSPILTATGGYNTAQVDLSLTLSAGAFENGGWHLLTNPFPSPINGAEFLSDNSARVSAYQIYNNSTDIFTVSGATAPATIDVGQSFWVQVGSAGTVSFQLDQITHGANSFVREVDPLEQAFVGVRVEQADGLHGITYLKLHEEAGDEYEWEHDVTFKHSGENANPEIYFELENGHELVVNAPGSLETISSIPVTVESGSIGNVSLMLDESFPLPSGLCMTLEDTETGEVIGLGGDVMEVELEPFNVYEDRFVISILETPVFEATASHCEGGVVHFNGEDSGIWDIQWSSSDGNLDGTGCVTGLETGSYIFEAHNPLNQCHTEELLLIEDVCMGDFNWNGERDITDLLMLLVGIQPVENFEGTFPDTDCDCDGVMTTLDLLMFLPAFGANCE